MTNDILNIGPIEKVPLPAAQRKSTLAVENALLELKPEESRTLPARFASTAKTAAKKLGMKITIRPGGDDVVRVFRKS
jgi:hypothetical protein